MQPQPPPEMLSFGGGSGSRMLEGSEQVEAASPISSRPPATNINFDELALADHDHHNQLGGSSSGGNRWPRQETLALLKVRSEMDVAFRDATLKGPLWDEVSRKLSELGYVRSAKKCKEKFENVHKYYKRTKEGRAGRQDGKTYRFFTQLEAMQAQLPPASAANATTTAHQPQQHQQQIVMASGPPTTTSTATVAAPPVQFATPISIGTGVLQPFTMYSTSSAHVPASAQLPASGATADPVGINFSSDSASSDSDDEVDDEDDDMMSEEDQEEEELEKRPASSNNPKRKRSSSGSGSWKASKRGRMMDFFQGLMKQVMQKQEAMQQKFLETIEKREQDRLMREQAWKQHEAARLSREQQLAAQERAMAASRDAAIVSFLHKITGQTIQLPQQPQPQPQPVVFTNTNSPAPAVYQVAPDLTTPAPASLQSRQQHSIQPQTNTELVIRQQQIISQMPPPPPPISSSEVIMAIPERQIPPSSQAGQELTSSSAGEAASSSRWPKAEVLALIKMRSNLENQYQEAGPKGPLWEEISAGMQRMGYNRSSKRCKEKWENINKYFKKVKESNKKRPEDAKTCPYFNELDALYQRKKLGSGSSSSSSPRMVQFQQQQEQQQNLMGVSQEGINTIAAPPPLGSSSSIVPGSSSVVQPQGSLALAAHVEPVSSERPSDGTINDQVQPSNIGGSRKPEDILMEQKQLVLEEDYNNNDQQKMDNNRAEDENDEDDQSEKERKMGYKIDQFQRETSNKNGGTSSSSFNITMVQ